MQQKQEFKCGSVNAQRGRTSLRALYCSSKGGNPPSHRTLTNQGIHSTALLVEILTSQCHKHHTNRITNKAHNGHCKSPSVSRANQAHCRYRREWVRESPTAPHKKTVFCVLLRKWMKRMPTRDEDTKEVHHQTELTTKALVADDFGRPQLHLAVEFWSSWSQNGLQ